MNLTKITDATIEPILLAEAKRHLREDVADATNDLDISALITVARTAAEDRTNRTFMPTTWERTFDAFPCLIELPRTPLISVTSIKYIDLAGTLQTLAPSAYLVDTSSEPGRVVPAYGTSWPGGRTQPGAVAVRYVAGYADASKVPGPIKSWIKLALTDLYQNRGRSNDKPAVPQNFADSLLDPYKIWSI